MPFPLADSPRLHLQVTDVLRQQAADALDCARGVRTDSATREAVSGMVRRVQETSRALGLAHVERAASRALRGLATSEVEQLLRELLEVCTGGLRVAPMLRPIAVVTGGGDGAMLHPQLLATSAAVRLLPDLSTLAQLSQREELGAVVMPVSLLDVAGAREAVGDALLFASGREEDLPSRLAAARHGAALFLPEPLDLRLVVQQVRGRMAAWRRGPWRVLVADRSRDRVEALAAALANEEITTIPAVGGFRLLTAIDETGPDLVVIGAPLDHMPMSDLAATLRGHHRLGGIPHLFLWEGGMVPAALTGHDVVQGSLDIPALRARVLAALDDRRRERALAEVDDLTGVRTAAALLTAADREVALARRRGEPLVAVRFELDDGAAVERRGGPMALATALRLLAQTALRAVRETDVVGVISESGLLVVMPDCSLAQVRARVAGVRQRFAQRLASAGNPGAAGLWVGLAEGVDDVLLRAERQLLGAIDAARGGGRRSALAGPPPGPSTPVGSDGD
jgi:GGDEF domain-containing protein